MEVVRQLVTIETVGAGRRAGPAVAFVNQNKVQVAVIAHLAAAELAKAKQGEAAGLARARAFREIGNAETLVERRLLQDGNLHQQGFRQIAERGCGGMDVVLAQDVADADA